MHNALAEMANHFQFIVALVFLFSIAISFNAVAHARGVINFAYSSSQINLDLKGNATYRGISIELSTGQQLSSGCAVYNKAVPLWDAFSQAIANFSTHFQFKIGVVGSGYMAGGDGLAFFLAPVDFEPVVNGEGRWLGLFNGTTDGNSVNHIVAVEFDTYKNDFDPDDNHVGINVNGIVSKKTFSLDGNATLKNGKYWDAWVDYDGVSSNLQVFLVCNPSGVDSNISKPENPILTYNIVLRDHLPKNIKVGLSAATGLSPETHAVFSWNFSSEYSWEIEDKDDSVKVILISVFASLVGLCAFIFLGVRWYLRRRGGEASHESDVELDKSFAHGPRKFSYAELSAATRNFKEDGKLGQGGFGGVYRGILPGTNETVAVKRISEGSKQGKKEYISEVTVISKLRHRNLVQLLGWCHEKGQLLLVYEFLPNGSLDDYIFGKGKGHLDWDRRYIIACDIASALVYLHEEWDQCVVHRDVKASNVMLDSNFNAKLGDFGLARVVERDRAASHTTVVAGTLGYLAPECVMTGKASPESDVFSFGALTLEIACGKRPVDSSFTAHNSRLVEWVWHLYGQGKILDAADERLGGNFNCEQMERLMLVGLLCSHPDPKARPSMKEVIKILTLEAQLPYVPLNMPVAVYTNPLLADSLTSSGSTSTTVNSSSIASMPAL